MYKYKKHRVKKGFILIYVMLTGILILSMVIVMFKVELNTFKYLQCKKENLLSTEHHDYCKENLFSMLNNILQRENICADRQTIIDFVKSQGSAANITFQDSKMQFISDSQLFKVVFPYDDFQNLCEYYNLEIYGGKMKMVLRYKRLEVI